MTEQAVDLRAEFAKLSSGVGGRYGFEADIDGSWWLTKDGRRAHSRQWRPADRWDVLVAATLLQLLNEAGPVPIEGDYLARLGRLSEQTLRSALRKAAYSLLVHHLLK